MFERFTPPARRTVELAQDHAKALRHPRVGTEHLLLALLAQPTTGSARVLNAHGVTLEGTTAALRAIRAAAGHELDAGALQAIGIDLDAVRASVEASFGEGALDQPGDGPGHGYGRFGHLTLSPRLKKAIELGLREAIRLRHREIRDEHLLLGILREGEGLAAQLLRQAGVDLTTIRTELEQQLRQAG
jgi:ATP-dependent Clp protease ATP-binding subunit ClpA